jgi:cell division protein FtsQ
MGFKGPDVLDEKEAGMEIRTNRIREEASTDAAPAPEKSQYLRRKTTQKLRKSHYASRRLRSILKMAGGIAVFVFISAMLASVFRYAYISDSFSLQSIKISGCKYADPQALEKIIRREYPRNTLQIDMKKLRDRLARETWIQNVDVRRILPSELAIDVYERIPKAILELQGQMMLADGSGILLDKNDPKYGKLDLPVFRGLLGDTPDEYRQNLEENSNRIQLGLQLLSELDSADSMYARNISEVDLSDTDNLKILLVNDTAEVFLGNKDFLRRFRTLMANMSQYQDLKAQNYDIAEIDLRYEGQIIYRQRQNEGEAANALAQAGKQSGNGAKKDLETLRQNVIQVPGNQAAAKD